MLYGKYKGLYTENQTGSIQQIQIKYGIAASNSFYLADISFNSFFAAKEELK